MALRRGQKILLLAHVIQHYNTALYTFLVPLLAPLFFPKDEPLTQMIVAYSLLATSTLTGPLGTWLITYHVPRNTRYSPLKISWIALGTVTLLFSLCPTQQQWGAWASAWLLILRLLHGVAAGAESGLARLNIMLDQDSEPSLRSSTHWYQCSINLGLVLASLFALLALSMPSVPLWRWGYLLGGLIMLFLAAIPMQLDASRSESIHPIPSRYTLREFLWDKRSAMLQITVAMALSYLTYGMTFEFFNAFIPLITHISGTEMQQWNTFLLILEMPLFMILGRYSLRYRASTVMRSSALLLALLSPFLFLALSFGTLPWVILARSTIMLLGVLFSCPLYFWCRAHLGSSPHRYMALSLAIALGATFLGRLATSNSLWLFQMTHLEIAPGLYVACVAFLAFWVIRDPLES